MSDEVAPGIFRIRLPLPRNPLRSVNCYVIPGERRSLIIDTGMNREECRDVLDPELEDIGVDLSRTDVFITHMHADHLGLAPHLTKGSTKVFMGADDISVIKETEYWSRMLDFAVRNGFPYHDPEEAIKKHPGYKYGPLGDMVLQPLYGGEILRYGGRKLETIHTPGHTKGHMCLLDRENGIFFSGDHILGDITPNISLWTDDTNPLSDFISSLGMVRGLGIEMVLPGHRSIIEDHEKRIDELVLHHQERAREVLEILGEGEMTGLEIASRMTWDLTYSSFDEFPVMQKWFALGEALAHIRYLEDQGKVFRRDNGIIHYIRE